MAQVIGAHSPNFHPPGQFMGNGQQPTYVGNSGHKVMQGTQYSYMPKSPWDPPAWTSPAKRPLEKSIATALPVNAGVTLTWSQRRLARHLAGLDVSLAAEIAAQADRLRVQRVQGRIERDLHTRSGKMQDAVKLVRLCQGCEPYTPVEAEDVVRQRIGRTGEHPLHSYGFLIHIALYPFTIILAIAGYLCAALSASAGRKTHVRCLQRALLMLVTFIMVLPISVVCVVVCAVPDILLLLARPLMPLRMKLLLLPWFFPTSLAFWSAGMCGFAGAFVSNILLGACPVGDGFVSMSLGGQLCNMQSDSLPISSAFQAAVVCAPHFMAHHQSLRSIALRGIPEFYAPAGGKLAQMPSVVQWAYLLRDTDLCAAWEAKCMDYLPLESDRVGGGARMIPTR